MVEFALRKRLSPAAMPRSANPKAARDREPRVMAAQGVDTAMSAYAREAVRVAGLEGRRDADGAPQGAPS